MYTFSTKHGSQVFKSSMYLSSKKSCWPREAADLDLRCGLLLSPSPLSPSLLSSSLLREAHGTTRESHCSRRAAHTIHDTRSYSMGNMGRIHKRHLFRRSLFRDFPDFFRSIFFFRSLVWMLRFRPARQGRLEVLDLACEGPPCMIH